MRSVTLVSALLLCSWISVSGSESHTVDVQPGHSVTLQCSSSLNNATYTFWSRLINRTTISCISYKYQFYSQFPCEGLKNSKYEMKSGISTISLAIKHVDVSDSGQYLCGFYLNGHTVLKVVDLNVQEEPDVLPNLMSVILGAVTVFLVLIIIVLAVKYRKIQKVVNKKQILQRNKNLDCDDLKAAPLTLYSATTVRSRRPEAERQVDTHVVYAASR
ncbi:uncharacterized protein [Channa argus]|uniref:uncharacterized protein isoform X2 n=1 Tax=Channa argus TaxID=215402 RepID=UPI0035214D01